MAVMEKKKVPAVFLDRDGTLNSERGYLHKVEEWEWLPGVPEALAMLARAGFMLVVVTNQSGIARGYYDEDSVNRLHEWVNEDLFMRAGVRFSAFYLCPHHPDYGTACDCRKPAPGMLLRAAAELGIDLARSWMIGDKPADIQAGAAAGCRSLLVLTGYGENSRKDAGCGRIHCFPGLLEAADYIIGGAEQNILIK